MLEIKLEIMSGRRISFKASILLELFLFNNIHIQFFVTGEDKITRTEKKKRKRRMKKIYLPSHFQCQIAGVSQCIYSRRV